MLPTEHFRNVQLAGGLQGSTPDYFVTWSFAWWHRFILVTRNIGKEVAISLSRGRDVPASTVSHHIETLDVILRETMMLRKQARHAPPQLRLALDTPNYYLGTFSGSMMETIQLFSLSVVQTILLLTRAVGEWRKGREALVMTTARVDPEQVLVVRVANRMDSLSLDAMLWVAELIEERRNSAGLEVVQYLSPLTGSIHVIDVRAFIAETLEA